MAEINKIIKDFWDKEADNFYKDNYSEYLYNFFSKIKNTHSKKVLDIGCGAGRNTIMLHKLGYLVYGCDLNENMVKATQRRLPLKNKKNIIICNMDALPYRKDFFDFVVSKMAFSIMQQAINSYVGPSAKLVEC